MKTKTTIKQTLLALTIALSIASCKKEKKADPAAPTQAISLTALKALSTGASVKAPDNTKISGIVISDISNKNIDNKTLILEDPAAQTGIVITFDAAQAFALGDQVEVNISNQTLAQVSGEIELTNVPAANAKKTGTGTITAKSTNAADVTTNKAAWDGTLVTLAATGLDGENGKYTGTLTVTDATGTVTSNVLAGAAFENTAYPAIITAVTGIVRIKGNEVLLNIRSTQDITAPATRFITEDFKTFEDNYPLFKTSVETWTNGNLADTWTLPPASDAFLQADRHYFYLTGSDNFANTYISTTDQWDLSALTTVSITFAGSKYNGNGVPFGVLDFYYILPFDSSKHKTGVTISLVTTLNGNTTNYPFAAADYSEVGKLYSLTTNIPTTVDELTADFKALADGGNSFWSRKDFNDPVYMKQVATNILSAGKFQIGISNNSTQREPDVSLSQYSFMPVAIDKIVFGFKK